MANKHNIYIDGIYSNENGDGNVENISIGDILEYVYAYTYDDLTDNSAIPRRVLDEKLEAFVQQPPLQIALPSGSALPYNLDLTETVYAVGFILKVELSLTASKSRIIYDVVVEENFNTDTGLIDSIDIYGHDSGDGVTTQDDLIITLVPTPPSI
jgi:hypothetical protein